MTLLSRRFLPRHSALIAVACLLAGGVALRAADKPAPATRPALTVTLAQPQKAEWAQSLPVNGNIAAWQESLIGAEANGLRLADVHVQIGDTVKRGQLLAQFADEMVLADVAQQKAAVAEAEAADFEAHENAERVRRLDDKAALSPQQITQILAQEKAARARLQAAQARLASETLRLKQTRVLAPDDGVISGRTATVGAVVPAGQELFRLVRRGRLEWQAELTSSESSRVKPGMAAAITAANGKQIKGTVRKLAPTVDAKTRNLIVYVDLQMADGTLNDAKPGMYARGELILGNSSALTVPGSAVVLRDGFANVFVFGAQNKVRQTKVKLGRQAEGRIEVEGLAANAAVVATGAGFLSDGDVVKVVKQ